MAASPSAFDPRIVEVDITTPDGTTTTFSNQNPALAITASGSAFLSANMNTCDCIIFNIPKARRNQLLTLASPLLSPAANSPIAQPQNRKPTIMTVKAGRQSFGTFVVFTGNVISCEMTQPPDIGLRLRSLTNNYNASLIYPTQFPPQANLKTICQRVAQANGLKLNFQAKNPLISNFAYTGSLDYLVKKVNDIGGIRATVSADSTTLIVVNADSALSGTGFIINQANGLVGIPQVTEQGVTVQVMLNPQIQLGGAVTIQSAMNPAANGTYAVVKMDYEIATRDQPFWYTLLCSNLGGMWQGSEGA